MDPCNFVVKHDEGQGYHFISDKRYYEFKPTIRDTLHALIDQHMKGRKKSMDNKDPPYNGLQYIPDNKKEKIDQRHGGENQ